MAGSDKAKIPADPDQHHELDLRHQLHRDQALLSAPMDSSGIDSRIFPSLWPYQPLLKML